MKNFAKELRKNSTLPEKILWHHLRDRNFLGYKFRRQVQIDNYIADFICYEARLIIELDGRQHLDEIAIKKDEIRTEYLMAQEFNVLRFYNTDILNNIDSVLERLKIELERPLTRPSDTLSRKGRGDETSNSKDTYVRSTSRKGRGDETKSSKDIYVRSTSRKGRGDEKSITKTPSSGFQPPSPVEGEGMQISKSYKTFKQQLRKWAKEERKKLDIEKISSILVQKLKETDEYRQAKNIMIFYPLKDEINLLGLLEDSDKNFYLPKIEGKNLLCCPFGKDTELCESCFKTKEPTTEPAEKDLIDLVIVPALAVDKNNYRLGYGGGFYDRFLIGVNIKKIVCIPKEFLIKTIYPEEYDIKIDKIITN